MCGDPWLKKGFAANFRTRPRTASISHYFCSFFYWSFQCNVVSFFAGRNAAGCPTECFLWILNKRPAAGATCQCLDRRQKELIPSIWSPSKIDTTHLNKNIVSFFSLFTYFYYIFLFCYFVYFCYTILNMCFKSFCVFCLFSVFFMFFFSIVFFYFVFFFLFFFIYFYLFLFYSYFFFVFFDLF